MADKEKTFDVSGPDKTPASATSRPIIVKHGSMAQRDPMVVEEAAEKPKTSEPAKATVAHELKLDPAESEKAETEADEAPESDQSAEVPTEESPEPEQPAESEESSENSGTGAVDALANEVDAKQADKKEKRELEERNAELEKSIAAKEFFVPIGAARRRRSEQRVILAFLLIILLSIAGLNMAIDAEVLDVGLPALTNVL